MAGTYLGAWLAAFVSGLFQMAVFALVMLAAAWFMFRPGPRADVDAPPRAYWKILIDGAVVGVLTGFVGVGGGFLIVPALVLLGGLSMTSAVASSLVIIALKSYAGFYKYLDVLSAEGLSLDWRIIGIFSAIGVAGSFLGNAVSRYVPQATLKKGFAVFLVVMAAYILYRSVPELFS